MKKIIVKPQMSKEMQNIFKVSQPRVSQALNFRRHSTTAKEMRLYALANGGVLLESKDILTSDAVF